MDETRANKIWAEIQAQVKRETGEKLPGEMSVNDFVKLMAEAGIELGHNAAHTRLEKMVKAGKLTRRKIFLRSENATAWLYSPVEQ